MIDKMENNNVYDFVIVGSGFGGSISAMRLAEKGYKVAILEEGLSWNEKNFPKTNWNVRKFLWFPLFRFFGFQSISFLKNLVVLHGKGVGGGSLVYANTLMRPHSQVFQHSNWPHLNNWQQELEPFYQRAEKMLGVTQNLMLNDAELALKKTAEQLGVAETFHPTQVGVYFGQPGIEVPDPYFEGEGPARSGCIACGGCMVGCRYNAKNMLTKNYLWFAQKFSAQIFSGIKVFRITPQSDSYLVETQLTQSWLRLNGKNFYAKKVILAAGVLGTIKLLLQNRDEFKTLPQISMTLGKNVRTNGESLLGVTSFSKNKNKDYSQGIAIGAAIHPNGHTKIEAVKYPEGSSLMRLLAAPLTENGTPWTRPLKMLVRLVMTLPTFLRIFFAKNWAQRSVILLVMQNIDSKIDLFLKKSFLFRRLSGVPTDMPSPSYIPEAQQAAQAMASVMEGFAQNSVPEVLLASATTAHILGGACMADSSEKGAIDSKHEVYGYPGLYICDGSVIPVNLGVNPSLTISALSERFAAQFPTKEKN